MARSIWRLRQRYHAYLKTNASLWIIQSRYTLFIMCWSLASHITKVVICQAQKEAWLAIILVSKRGTEWSRTSVLIGGNRLLNRKLPCSEFENSNCASPLGLIITVVTTIASNIDKQKQQCSSKVWSLLPCFDYSYVVETNAFYFASTQSSIFSSLEYLLFRVSSRFVPPKTSVAGFHGSLHASVSIRTPWILDAMRCV